MPWPTGMTRWITTAATAALMIPRGTGRTPREEAGYTIWNKEIAGHAIEDGLIVFGWRSPCRVAGTIALSQNASRE